MKKLLLLFLGTTLLFSCSDDDSSTARTTQANFETEILDRWYVSQSEDIDGDIYTANDCEQNGYIQFNEDGTNVESYFYDHPNDGCINDIYVEGTYTYNASENELVITDEFGDVFNYSIESVSTNELVLNLDSETYYFVR
tara:strand:+ start:78 stop:497 length:420 start_codon:yes stop_codon:yes gene_type:complete